MEDRRMEVSGYSHQGIVVDIIYGETGHPCEVQFFSGEEIVGKTLHTTGVEGNKDGSIPIWDTSLDSITKGGKQITKILVPSLMKEDVFKAVTEARLGDIKISFERIK